MVLEPDEFVGEVIGYWSEIKLEIIKKYATSYSQILAAQREPAFEHFYIDGFAAAGINRSRATGELIPGSPLNALMIDPPFKGYHFIDLNGARVEALEELARERPEVIVHPPGDCNEILREKVFPEMRWDRYRRALCLLDPWGMHVHWEVIQSAADTKTIEIFLNFPIGTMNRNVLFRDQQKVTEARAVAMDRVWGDRSWLEVTYPPAQSLFGEINQKTTNDAVATAFQERLKKVAGFKFVPRPIPMRNSRGNILYYIFFAAHNPTAGRIVTAIFDKYRRQGVV